MQFVLTGFSQDTGFRVFTFEGMGADRVRIRYVVRADLALVRRYAIPIQELPLLCRMLLDQRGETGDERTLTYTENEMAAHATERASARALLAQKKKTSRRPPAQNLGSAWRAPQMSR